MAEDQSIISIADVESSIFLIQGQKVMLNKDFGWLYKVTPKVLIGAAFVVPYLTPV